MPFHKFEEVYGEGPDVIVYFIYMRVPDVLPSVDVDDLEFLEVA